MYLRHIEGMGVKGPIPRLLMPAHLSMITSLELMLRLETQDTTDTILHGFRRLLRTYNTSFSNSVGSSLGPEAFKNLLQILPCSLLNLNYLDFSLRNPWYPYQKGDDGENMELSEANIMMPFDDLVRKLPTTLANVAIPTSPSTALGSRQM